MTEIWRMGAVQLAGEIAAKRISSVEAVAGTLARVDATNPKLNAITYNLSERSREQARAADQAIAEGAELGPLHGVPITIKENIDMAGLPTPNGIAAFENLIAPANSPVVDHLERAGAIVVGRTNTPEFSLRWFTDNPLRGLTLNPWNDEITPGGSSGGAASAVAAGMCQMGHGNDVGGSLRYPAYCCGLSTIRPSFGRVPAYNPSGAEERPPAIQLMSVQGPICREVKDTRACLKVMAQRDVRDPYWQNVAFEGDAVSQPVRVALTRGLPNMVLHSCVEQALEDAAEMLRDAGYEVVEQDPPNLDEVAALWCDLMSTDVHTMLGDAVSRLGSEDAQIAIKGLMGGGEILDREAYVRRLSDRMRLMRNWNLFLEDFPLVLAPISAAPPYPHGYDVASTQSTDAALVEQAMLYVVNLLGLPAAAQPTGLAGGLPTGVQIIGRPMREDLCLDAAQAIEARTGILAHVLWKNENL